jgi:hypothetical protein
MSTLKATYLQQASSASPNITLDASTNATVAGTLAMGSSFKRNRIINGNMVVDQRNAGASVTPTNGAYTIDRWTANLSQASKFSIQQNAGSVTPPAGFSNYLGITSLSSYSVTGSDYFGILQPIEGYNMSDLAWGTASAKTITISFWVRSSLTGTFGGALRSDTTTSPATLSYPFSYSIPSANTWTYITITVAGPTNGTWVTGNTSFVQLWFGIGAAGYAGTAGSWASADYRTATGATSVVGTNGATFYITGVQLEVGSVATPYERQIYSDQLAQCQRYLPYFSGNGIGNTYPYFSLTGNTTQAYVGVPFLVQARTSPTGIIASTASGFALGNGNTNFTCTSIAFSAAGVSGGSILATVASGLTQFYPYFLVTGASSTFYFTGCEL